MLRRTKEVPKAAKGGPRDRDLHEKTIVVSEPDAIKDQLVYIFDDVWTTGSTLTACTNLMYKAGAKKVQLFAVGKTISTEWIIFLYSLLVNLLVICNLI